MRSKNRKKLLFYVLTFILVSTTLAGCSSNKDSVATINRELTVEEKVEDFEYMYKTLEENYPFFKVNERVNRINWLANKDEYKKRIKETRNDEEFANELNMIICELNNDHTHLLSKDAFDSYYKLYAYKADKYNKPWGKVLDNKKVKARYNFTEKNLEELKNENYLQNSKPAFKSDIIIPNDVAYIKVKQMDGFRIEEDGVEIRKFLESIKDYPKLIVDIRGNGGGSDYYWVKNIVQPLINKPLSVDYYLFAKGGEDSQKFYKARKMNLKDISTLDENLIHKFPEEISTDFKYYKLSTDKIKPKNPVGFKGKIYLLVNSGVYSSSERFASFAKGSGFATLVGGRTGGDGIGIDPLLFSLPNSGLVVRYSSLLCLNPDYTINEEVQTTPDIELSPFSPVDHKYDECIQYVINDEI